MGFVKKNYLKLKTGARSLQKYLFFIYFHQLPKNCENEKILTNYYIGIVVR